jgi:peptidoglycan/LPS O-acetylase OafA/YrhL
MGALRLLLAISVVLFHAHGLFHFDLAGGILPVETFFMISGFVMALVLSTKYDPIKDRRLFYTNRALRIYVPYFAIVGFALVVAAFAFQHSGSGPFAAMKLDNPTLPTILAMIVTHITIVGQDLFLFFRLNDGALQWSGATPGLNVVLLLLLPPAWSISLELVFYALAPWLIRASSRALLGVIAASLCLRLIFWRAGLPPDPWSYRFLPTEICFFLAGMLAYRLYAAMKRRPRADALLGLALIAALFAYQPASELLRRAGLSPGIARWIFYAFAVFGLPALFASTNRSRFDRFLGDFSYAVYLVHWPTLVLIDAISPDLNRDARAAVALLASLLLAYGTAQLIERPLDRLRQQRFAARAGAGEFHPGPGLPEAAEG